jgi:hypothetical protein
MKGSIRFPLPASGTVVRYGFEVAGKMVDALSVPLAKATEVAYKEREAGHNVSNTKKMTGNQFEVVFFVPFVFFLPVTDV